MGSWSDLCSHRDQAELGAKLDSKNSGHPRAVEQAEECLGGLLPFCQTWGKERWQLFSSRQGALRQDGREVWQSCEKQR